MTIYNNITELTGKTPLNRLSRLVPENGANVLAKLEYFNPTHSVKDRIAVAIVDAAEQKGLLSPDSIILEATSGNTGIGLAFTATARGYKSTIVMPESANSRITSSTPLADSATGWCKVSSSVASVADRWRPKM